MATNAPTASLLHGPEMSATAGNSGTLIGVTASPQPAIHGNAAKTGTGAQLNDAQLPAQESNPATPPMVVQSARLVNGAGAGEMRVGVNSAAFGSIELQTHVNQDHVSASISTGHGELHAAMVAEMPSLERAMGQHHLQLDQMDLNARSGAQQQSSGEGGHARQQAEPGIRLANHGLDPAAEAGGDSPAHSWIAPVSAGLSVHA